MAENKRMSAGHFCLFSDEGNALMASGYRKLQNDILGGYLKYENDIDERLTRLFTEVQEAGHTEVFDTEVRDIVFERLEPIMNEACLDFSKITFW